MPQFYEMEALYLSVVTSGLGLQWPIIVKYTEGEFYFFGQKGRGKKGLGTATSDKVIRDKEANRGEDDAAQHDTEVAALKVMPKAANDLARIFGFLNQYFNPNEATEETMDACALEDERTTKEHGKDEAKGPHKAGGEEETDKSSDDIGEEGSANKPNFIELQSKERKRAETATKNVKVGKRLRRFSAASAAHLKSTVNGKQKASLWDTY